MIDIPTLPAALSIQISAGNAAGERRAAPRTRLCARPLASDGSSGRLARDLYSVFRAPCGGQPADPFIAALRAVCSDDLADSTSVRRLLVPRSQESTRRDQAIGPWRTGG